VTPLELKRGGQFVNVFVEHFHYPIIAAIDYDFANPDRARRLNSHRGISPGDPGPGHPPEPFPHALEKTRPIVVPLIVIIVADEIGHSFPVSVVDRVKEVFRVQPDLMLRSPKPEEIYADANSKR
jgi:hypothetical protein